MLHKNIPAGDIHTVANWEVADAAALNALTPVSGDDGKIAWRQDNNALYILADYAGPTWAFLGSGSVPGTHGSSHHSGGGDAIKLDDLAAPDDNTDLNASTSAHGLVVKATAPSAGLINVVGIANAETAYTNKPLFDATNPAALGTAAPGSATVAARRDHVHTLPKIDDLAAADDNTDLNVSTTAHGLAPKLSNVATEYLSGTGVYSVPPGSATAQTAAVYVSKVGSDAAAGTLPSTAKLTIGSAITAASSLITGGAPAVRVEVLDGGTYAEDIVIPANVHVFAPAARLVGAATIEAASSLFIDKHFAASNNQNMAEHGGGSDGPAIYIANISDGRGTGGALTGVKNVRNVGGGGKNFFVRVGILYVGESGVGIGDVSSGNAGHIHFTVPDLYLAGASATGILGSAQGAGASNIIGFSDHILELGALATTVGISVIHADAIVKVVVAEIIADTAYSITAGSLYLGCPKITGTRTGTPVNRMIGTEDSATTLQMATARLLGRSTAGTGAVEEITLGTNLSFTGTTLNAAGGTGDVATDTIWDAAGDLVQGSGSDTAVRLAIGTAGQVLTVNAGATAAEWAAAAGGAVATDAIWDAAGDLAVGTGANTAAKLTMGSALQVLRVNAGATALEYATPFAAQLVENDPILFDAAGSADGKYSGLAIAGTAGAALAFGDLCYLAVADSRWELADADAEATAGGVMLGICVLAAAADADPTRMLLIGNVRADTAFPALTIGAPAYVGTTAGDIQVAQPSGTDDVIRVVGHALTADELFFNPSRDWMTYAA